MVSCQPSFQSYKIDLKTCDQSVIEHNLVTIYLNLEWHDNINDNPNLLIHIFDKKFAPKLCKNEYLPLTLPLPFHHSAGTSVAQSIEQYPLHQPQLPSLSSQLTGNPSSIYRPSSSSLITNASPSSTTNIPPGDHNDVSSTTTTTTTTTTMLYNSLPSSISPRSIPPLKINPTTTNTYRHQTSPPCSSSNQGYFNIEGDSQISPTLKSISPISSTNIPNQTTPVMTQVIDIRQTPPNNNSNSTSSSFKAFLCSDLKPHLNVEQPCSASVTTNAVPSASTILCRSMNHHRSLAQRAAVASQIRTNRSISMIPMKEQGQTTTTNTFFPLTTNTVITNQTTTTPSPPIATSPSGGKKSFVRQRSVVPVNNRNRKRRINKQLSLPLDRSVSTSFYKQQNDVQSSPTKSLCSSREEQTSPTNTIVKSPRKLFSPFAAQSIQTTVSNSDIDQTIEEVINGKGEIIFNENNSTYAVTAAPVTPAPPQPSSQLVWVQNGAVTTKTWLSPLYQKQPTPPLFDPQPSSLTHQDVVNIAQQVVFPSVNESTKINNVALPIGNSKRRNRSKSTSSTPTKRNRQRKPPIELSQSAATAAIIGATSPSPTTITPTLNLISKPVLPSSSSTTTTTMATMATNNASEPLTLEKNDLWQNVDSMLDDFHLVAIDDHQRLSNLHSHFDFDLSIDRFPSSTPPPPGASSSATSSLTMSSSMDKSLHSQHHYPGHSYPHPHPHSYPYPHHQGKLTGADVDVYEHFLNPLPITSTAVWQENQVTSSVATPPDFQLNSFPQTSQTTQQQYYTSISDENYHSQVRLLFDVQS